MANKFVVVMMGSKSDHPVMDKALAALDSYGIDYECRVLSAHRTPAETQQYVIDAEARGAQVFIAAAGMAAHLAGVVAAHTIKPVIGVPIASGALQGQDALLATVMMPPGIPVATVAIDGAKNAAHLAAQMMALSDAELAARIDEFRDSERRNILGE
ncbi:MAG: 5-(carboxyamino)imidazole ribonucleotide mutase [Gammaproteobacteria bacterium]|nr:MAG: 5-(carboxyamino)imidazole ribonucleotide mutase [Gammaproteobacteria bacterium]